MSNAILVTGCGRSGSSMVAGVLGICGAFSGVVDKQNENVRIKDEVITPYFKRIGADPAGQYPLPDPDKLVIPTKWGRDVLSILASEGYTADKWNVPWLYKSSRSALIWPVWSFSFPDAKWVIVRRRTGDILRSCSQTAYMNAFNKLENLKSISVPSTHEGWRWWVHQFEARFVEMITAGLNCQVVWPERFVDGDYRQLHQVLEWLGLPWRPEVLGYIDPKLWKVRKADVKSLSQDLGDRVAI